MRIDHEEILARNPVLMARCFWHLSNQFGVVADGRAPSLPLFVIASSMLFHAESVEKIHRMNFDSGLLKVVTDRPDLLAGLQRRLESSGTAPPGVVYRFSPDRKGEHPQQHLQGSGGILQADAYAGFTPLYAPRADGSGQFREAACWAHLRRDFDDVWEGTKSEIAREALDRIGK